jgi:hypothetical protein
VLFVKQKLMEVEPISIENQVLLFEGRKLNDNQQQLNVCGINDGSSVFLVIKLTSKSVIFVSVLYK